jgi:hypothetical protein
VCQYGVPELADSQVQRLGRAVICGSLADGSARRNFLNDLRFSVLRAARCAATGLCGGSESEPNSADWRRERNWGRTFSKSTSVGEGNLAYNARNRASRRPARMANRLNKG